MSNKDSIYKLDLQGEFSERPSRILMNFCILIDRIIKVLYTIFLFVLRHFVYLRGIIVNDFWNDAQAIAVKVSVGPINVGSSKFWSGPIVIRGNIEI